MRKLLNIFTAALLLPLLFSCAKEIMEPGLPALEGFEGIEPENNCIILKLDLSGITPSVATRAATERGVDKYKENRITTIDCFFYRTGESGSNAIFQALGRSVEKDTAKDSTECYVKVYYNDDIATTLFGNKDSGTCEAFVIANLTSNYSASTDVESLKNTLIEYDFSQQEIQPYFAMNSRKTAQVTLYSATSNGVTVSTAAGRVPLYRCAAKSQLFLQLPETFSDGVDPAIYAPCPDSLGGMRLCLKSGMKKSRIYSEYESEAADYITYPYYPFSIFDNEDLVEGKEEYKYSHTPFYSYPMSWSDLDDNAADFIFIIPWHKVKESENGAVVDGEAEERYYKISSNVVGRKFESNHYYRTFINIQSRGAEDLDAAEEIPQCSYIISDWIHEGLYGGEGTEAVHGEFIRYNFLVVEPDERTLNNETTCTFDFKSSSDLKDAKVLIDSVCFYKYNSGSPVRTRRAVGNNVTTVNQRTSGNASFIDENEYRVTYNYEKGEIYFTHELDNVYEQRDIYLTVTNKDEISQRVIIHQKPAIMLELHEAGDVFVNGRFGRVANGGSFGTNRLYYYNNRWDNGYTTNGIYYHCLEDFSYNGSNYGYNILETSYGSVIVEANNFGAGIASVFFTTEINISAFNSSNYTYLCNGVETEYRIGDPRVRAASSTDDGGYGTGWSLDSYLYNNNGAEATRAWNNPGDILICSMREQDRNLIAPRFLISSALNANYSLTWEQAVKRGATYQEVGYPAGRWRLPTEAEMAYIVARQLDETIPGLYSTNTQYWAGSGRLMTTNTTGSNTFSNPASGVKQSCRYVYDLWYWGDDAASSTEYHPNGHNTNY